MYINVRMVALPILTNHWPLVVKTGKCYKNGMTQLKSQKADHFI